jgi:hypothetical protein
VAFGRSDHFGGATGPDKFNSPENVIHLDFIYLPGFQPDILIKEIRFFYEAPVSSAEIIMKNNAYQVF